MERTKDISPNPPLKRAAREHRGSVHVRGGRASTSTSGFFFDALNKQEHRQLQLIARAAAAEALLLLAASLVRDALPHASGLRSQSVSAIHKKLSAMREDYQQMTFPERSPVESDLWAAELQEAFDDLSKRFVAAIEKAT